MIEVVGNLWEYGPPDAVRVITTNGTIRKDGAAVMGRGCAAEAAKRYPFLPVVLGNELIRRGNHVHNLSTATRHDDGLELWSFPVKHNWWEVADLDLIESSAHELRLAMNAYYSEDVTVVMPRPGCGNGHLKWEDVRPVIAEILDDRFHVITWK